MRSQAFRRELAREWLSTPITTALSAAEMAESSTQRVANTLNFRRNKWTHHSNPRNGQILAEESLKK